MQSATHITKAAFYFAVAALVIAIVFLATNACVNIDADMLMNVSAHVIQLLTN